MGKATAILAAALALGGCSKDDKAAEAGDRRSEPCGEPAPRDTSAAIAELIGGVPGDAIAIGFVDLPAAPWQQVTTGFVAPLSASEQAALDEELRGFVAARFGLDLSRAQFAVGYLAAPAGAGAEPTAAVLIKSVSGAALAQGEDHKGARLRRIDGETSVGSRGDLVVLGHDVAVRAVLDTLAGERGSVTRDKPELVEWLKGQSQGAYLAAAVTTAPGLTPPPPLAGLSRAAVALGGDFARVAVEGDDSSLAALEGQAAIFFGALTGEVEGGRQRALGGQGEPADAIGAIVASHYARSLIRRLQPVRKGNRLEVDLQFDVGGGGMVYMLGVGAAVAIPAFTKYVEKSREAELHLEPPPPPVMPNTLE
jgi:hypothetical protein